MIHEHSSADPGGVSIDLDRLRAAARTYLARGWHVLPLAGPKGKTPWDAPQNCARFDWRAFRFSDADVDREFSGRVTGLGVILGANGLPPENGDDTNLYTKNLLDSDLDCPDALAVADRFLAPTGCEWGRPSTPRAHRLVIGDAALPIWQFRDVLPDGAAGEMLLELRGAGGQSALPPSFHVDSREFLAFDTDGDPAHVETAAYSRQVTALACAVLLGRHWPRVEGSRHAIAVPLAGMLLGAGLERALVETIVRTAAERAGDREANARVTDVGTTATRLDAGRPTTGGPTLAALLGEPLVKTLRAWLTRAGWTADLDAYAEAAYRDLRAHDAALDAHDADPRGPGREPGEDDGDDDDQRAAPSVPIRPHISVTGRLLDDLTNACIAALCEANSPPILFTRGYELARVVASAEGTPTLRRVTEPVLRNRLADVATFSCTRGRTATDCAPPQEVAAAVVAREQWPAAIPPVTGITETPVLRPDGTILDTPGYDPATRLVYTPSPTCTVPPIPMAPTAAERAAALDLLDDLIADFPFVDAASRANALAALITPLVLPVVASPIPLALFDKPAPGTGASLLLEVIALVATGRTAATLKAPSGDYAEEEWRKLLTATLREGAKFINIDNITGTLRSAALAKAISGEVWKDRILCVSETVELPLHVAFYATANNLQLGGTDLPRRIYSCRMDAKMPHPEDRKPETFRHPDLLDYVKARRGDLIAAGLTLARAWVAAGRPVTDPPTLGGFQRWANVLSGILHTAGVPHFLGNQHEVHADLDTHRTEWTTFVAAWFDLFQAEPQRVQTVVTVLRTAPDSASLRAALPSALVDALKREGNAAQRFGQVFQKHRDQVFLHAERRLRFEKAEPDLHTKVAQWRVRRIDPAGDEPAPEREPGQEG
jgi:hypothetical protein